MKKFCSLCTFTLLWISNVSLNLRRGNRCSILNFWPVQSGAFFPWRRPRGSVPREVALFFFLFSFLLFRTIFFLFLPQFRFLLFLSLIFDIQTKNQTPSPLIRDTHSDIKKHANAFFMFLQLFICFQWNIFMNKKSIKWKFKKY